ncbi:hypothetical protein PENTCL1PPCAC_9056, partial [Pristionchus entomophagus]
LWELYSNGETPYEGMNRAQILEMLTKQNERLKRPEKCPEEVHNRMQDEFWNIDEQLRPTFADIVPFFSLLVNGE